MASNKHVEAVELDHAPGSVDMTSEQTGKFPFHAFEFSEPSASNPYLKLLYPWAFYSTRMRSYNITDSNYTVLDNDGYSIINVSTGGSDRTITLPTAADNTGRVLFVAKSDSGAGDVIVDGEGAETIEGLTTLYLPSQYSFVGIFCTGTVWLRIAGPICPSTQGSWGTPHTYLKTLVDDVDPTTTNNVTVTASNAADGSKGIFGYCMVLSSATVGRILYIKNSAGSTFAQANNPTTANYGRTSFMVPLDANKQFLYSVNNADVDHVYIIQGGYFV